MESKIEPKLSRLIFADLFATYSFLFTFIVLAVTAVVQYEYFMYEKQSNMTAPLFISLLLLFSAPLYFRVRYIKQALETGEEYDGVITIVSGSYGASAIFYSYTINNTVIKKIYFAYWFTSRLNKGDRITVLANKNNNKKAFIKELFYE